MQSGWITKYFDSFTLGKGLDYYKQGRVKHLNITPKQITAKIWGRDINPYDVVLSLGKNGISWAECSCPVEYSCKHCAATAYAALSANVASGLASDFKPKEKIVIVAKQPKIKKPPVPFWKKVLQPIANLQINEKNLQQKTEWQLQIILRTQEFGYYMQSRYGQQELAVELRPRRINLNTNKTLYTEVNWRQLPTIKAQNFEPQFRPSANELPPKYQLAWLYRLLEFLQPNNYFYSLKDWQTILPENASLIFEHLKTAEQEGIEILDLGGQKISIQKEFAQKQLVILDGKDGGINLSVKYIWLGNLLDGVILEVGSPTVFLLYCPDAHLQNAPFVIIPVQTAPEQFKEFDKPLKIAKEDIEIFKKDFLPQLLLQYKITSLSSKIVLPKLGQPQLVLDVTKNLENNLLGLKIVLTWKYENINLDFINTEKIINPQTGQIIRNFKSEYNLEQKIIRLFLNAGINIALLSTVKLNASESKNFLQNIIPVLTSQNNFIINLGENLPSFKEVEEPAKIEIEMENDGSVDWFDLQVIVVVEGVKIPLAEIIYALAGEEDSIFLPDGRYLSLSKNPDLQKLRALLKRANKLKDSQNGKIKISRFEAGWFEQIKELGILTKQSREWEESVGKLKSGNVPEILEQPKQITLTLRPYQIEGYSWLQFLKQNKLGGILADDMGLGKTAQSLALLSQLPKKIKNPSLIVAPTSVVESWETEIQKFAPHLKSVILRSGDRVAVLKNLHKHNLVVTSYALLRRDFEILQKQPWEILILDEAHVLKNYQSQSYALVRQLSAQIKFGLTGTPMENNLSELWSVFSIVCPGLFSGIEHFREAFQRPIEKNNDKNALETLRRQIRPFMLRRKKELVEKDLPPKIEQVVFMDLEPKHREIYDLHLAKHRQEILGLLQNGGFRQNRFQVLAAITRLRQLCLHPILVDSKHSKVEAVKIEGLMEQVESIVDGGHQIIIFSQFTSFLSLVKDRLKTDGYIFSYIDGGTKNRKIEIENFQNGKTKIFLISLKAGGFGLNLTAADYCFLLDPWWNPAAENQAIDRAHRLGQTKKVMVYRFIAKNTIEEKVLKLQEKKRALFKSVLEEGEFFAQMITEEDIKNILE